MDIEMNRNSLRILKNKEVKYDLPYLWIRDNCPCQDCRVEETKEKRFMLSNVPVDLKPSKVKLNKNSINIFWPDHHKTELDIENIALLSIPRKPKKELWTNNFVPKYFDWIEFLQNKNIAIDAFSNFITHGAICIKNAPCVLNTLEDLAKRLGPIREVLFERIHNVSVDGHVYNIAHTSLEVPPHNDFASYSWPPSVQALHMLVNECEGGESMIIDGFSVLEDYKIDCPNFFNILCNFSVPFREFDDENETFANEPMIRLDKKNQITGFRFSNQLMQMIDPNIDGLGLFYEAYHELCKRINSEKYKSIFRLEGGHILLVSAHRVLHGRREFKQNGKRHLQDAYFEMDNVENNLVLYKNQESS